MFAKELRKKTHMHVIGSTGKGKSKFLEHLIRQDIQQRQPFCLIDWHGTLYRDVLEYLARMRPSRKFIFLNLSDPSHIIPFNPFSKRGLSVSVQVNRRIDATIKPWGMVDTNQAPTLEKMLRLVYTFAVESGEPLQHAALLLFRKNAAMRKYAMRQVSNSYLSQTWEEVDAATIRDWYRLVESSQNRFTRFVGIPEIKRVVGQKSGSLDIRQAVESGTSILVNLGQSDYLDTEAARVFAALLLNEFFEVAMIRKNLGRPSPLYYLYLDEFQEFITPEMSKMLDAVRGGGFHLVLSHQHLAHLGRSPELLESMMTNCQIKVVFGGMWAESARVMAEEMFLHEINERKIKEDFWRTISIAELKEFQDWDYTSGSSSGQVGEAETSSDSSSWKWVTQRMLIPRYEKELSGRAEFTREEKVSICAELLKEQPERVCHVKLPDKLTEKYIVPEVRPARMSRARVREYEKEKQVEAGGLDVERADQLLLEAEREFLEKVKPKERSYSSKPRKPAVPKPTLTIKE